jgi:hypothetical protein
VIFAWRGGARTRPLDRALGSGRGWSVTIPMAIPVQSVPQGMSVRYRITRYDILRIQLRHHFRNRLLIVAGIAFLAYIAFREFNHIEVADRSLAFKCFFAASLAVFWGGIFALVSVATLALGVLFLKSRGLFCEHIVEIKEAGLIERTDVNDSLHLWAGLTKVVSTGAYLYIYFGSTAVHAIPKKAFGSAYHARAFQDEIMKHWKGS